MRKAVILSGGLGVRLKPFTNVIPKPLLPIGEKAVLEIQIERFKQFQFDEIYLATNYKADYIENFIGSGARYGVKIQVSKEEKPLGTAGPLKLLEGELKENPFIVMNGDILSLLDYNRFYEFGMQQDSLLTVAIKRIITPFEFGNIYFEGDYVTKIEEKPNIISYALAGIYFMKPEILKLIPEHTYYGMDTLIMAMLKVGMKVSKFEFEDYWLDIGRLDDFEKAQGAYDDIYGKD